MGVILRAHVQSLEIFMAGSTNLSISFFPEAVKGRMQEYIYIYIYYECLQLTTGLIFIGKYMLESGQLKKKR